ncbi:MAG: excisionase family DNA binding protein [Candidatus Omnitrophota bacterium]|jgi:excisionase family DNA binding protein
MPKYLTVNEISNYLKLPEETVYKHARSGKLPAFKVGRYWRFKQEEIDQWVTMNSNNPYSNMQLMVIDDDPMVRELMGSWLTPAGCIVDSLGDAESALSLLSVQYYDLIFLDLMMPSMDGAEAMRRIMEIAPKSKVVIITGYFDSKLMENALALGPVTVLKKPFDKETVLKVVKTYAMHMQR